MYKTKPKDIEKYIEWLKVNHSVNISKKNRNYYESVSNKICSDFKTSSFWSSLIEQFNHINQEYYLATGFNLFVYDYIPKIDIKSFDSFLLKTYRKNVINNMNWPSEPEGGWILPSNWYSNVNDIVRTCFVVKYLDGVQFFIEKLQSLCKVCNLPCIVDYEAKEEGYYAAHTYIKTYSNIPKEDWDTKEIEVLVELQITTQLQEVIRKLIHKYYEDRRKNLTKDELKWQWDYKSDEFATNYLGHILHYVEGMIMAVRDRQEEM